MSAKLIAEDGLLRGLVLSLEEGEDWVIGRDPHTCQLLVEDPSVSRKHLHCHTEQEGLLVENLSATYPLQINEQEKQEPTLLKHGDTVKIGSSSFRLYTKPIADLPEGEEITEISPAEKEEIFKDPSSKGDLADQDTIFDVSEESGEHHLADIDFALSETGRWLLKVIAGPNNGAEFPLEPSHTYVMGTDPGQCDIIFHDTSVSRKHAQLSIDEEFSISIEDLESKNGTYIDTQTIQGKQPLSLTNVVTLGTTSFVVYDREGEMHTLISPLLPSIVKTLQQEEEKKKAEEEAEARLEEEKRIAEAPPKEEEEEKKTPPQQPLGAFILIGVITTLFVLAGVGITFLFRSAPIHKEEVADPKQEIEQALAPFTGIKWSFNKANGRLFLIGHVITQAEKNQLLHNLQPLTFIRRIDGSGIIIDEYVWKETNKVLERNPNWRGINIYSPSPGRFILSGYLETRKEAEELSDYININFPYIDLLENKIVIEENVVSAAIVTLQRGGFSNVTATMNNGELTLIGSIATGSEQRFRAVVEELRTVPGVQSVKNFVVQVAKAQAVKNISNRYRVAGSSHQNGVYLSVVINGRILHRGDEIDGLTITKITKDTIFLEKGEQKYRIDY